MKTNFIFFNINASINNTIITITDNCGRVILWKSPGCIKLKGSKKSTPYASQKTTEIVCKEIIKRNRNNVVIKVKGFGSGRDSAIRTISSFKSIKILGIMDTTSIAHNGCRPPKRRRI